MKLKIADLERAKDLAGQRVHLAGEHRKLTTVMPIVRASLKVVLQPQHAHRSQPIEVEICENKEGVISQAILDFAIRNISERIARLDEELAELGIEVTD